MRKRTLVSTILAISTGATLYLTGCRTNHTDHFERSNPYTSYGIVQKKEISPDNMLRQFNLKKTNEKGEVFVDDYYVWLKGIPEMPGTLYGLDSPGLYNSVAEGDTVGLILRDHQQWVEDSEGNRLTIPKNWIEIVDYRKGSYENK